MTSYVLTYHRFREKAVKGLCDISCMSAVVVTVIWMVGCFHQGYMGEVSPSCQ